MMTDESGFQTSDQYTVELVEIAGHLITDDPRRFLRALFNDPEIQYAVAEPIEGEA